MKKLVTTVLASALIMIASSIVLGYLFNFLFPSVKAEYQNSALYRPWSDPLMYLFIIQPFMLSGVLVWGWEKIKNLFQGSAGRKAINVSLFCLVLFIIPGMLMTLSTFKVSILAILTWTVSSFIQVWAASLVFIRMSK